MAGVVAKGETVWVKVVEIKESLPVGPR